MLRDKLFERHRRPSAELVDEVVGAGKDAVLMVDRDLAQVLERLLRLSWRHHHNDLFLDHPAVRARRLIGGHSGSTTAERIGLTSETAGARRQAVRLHPEDVHVPRDRRAEACERAASSPPKFAPERVFTRRGGATFRSRQLATRLNVSLLGAGLKVSPTRVRSNFQSL
jgi:hypothetical protein